MSTRAASRLAWSLLGLDVVLVGLGIAFAILNDDLAAAASPVDPDVVIELLYPAIGAFIASRRPRNPIGWIFLTIGLVQAVNTFAGGYARYALLTEPGSLPGGAASSWIESWTWIPALWLIVTFLLLLFPGGKLPSRRWRWVARLAAGGIALATVSFAAISWPLRGVELLDETGPEDEGGLVLLLGAVGFAATIVAALACVGSLFVRLQRSRGEERQQLKWFLYAGALALAGVLTAFLPFGAPEIVLDVALLTLPVAAAIAILRYRLYDIDLIIRRTLVYGVLTAGLAGLYLGIVLALQQVFSSFAGGSDLAIAVSTLAVAALFRPVRTRIQAFVDRRFYRRKYDAQRTLEAFSAHLRDEIDLDALAAELRTVVRETMHPGYVSLWLRTPKAER